jgi:putative ABC transport system permease protein
MNFEIYEQQFQVGGKSTPKQQEAARFAVTPDYFRTMEIPLLQGRTFNEQTDVASPPVVIINRRLAEQNWPNENPVGKQIRLLGNNQNARLATVVGVVGDSKEFLMHDAARPQIFFPQLQAPSHRRFLVVKSAGDPMALTSAVRASIEAVDRNVPITNVRRMERVVSEAMSPFFFASTILGALGLAALVLAAMGIYGVISYVVRQRTHEIGVRMAMGARRREIMRLVLRQGAHLAAIGLVIGLVAAMGMMHLIRTALTGSRFDPLVLLASSVLLAAIALLACYLPARRATKVDPMVALRYE